MHGCNPERCLMRMNHVGTAGCLASACDATGVLVCALQRPALRLRPQCAPRRPCTWECSPQLHGFAGAAPELQPKGAKGPGTQPPRMSPRTCNGSEGRQPVRSHLLKPCTPHQNSYMLSQAEGWNLLITCVFEAWSLVIAWGPRHLYCSVLKQFCRVAYN